MYTGLDSPVDGEPSRCPSARTTKYRPQLCLGVAGIGMVCFAWVRFPTFPLEDGITSLKTQFELEYWPGALDTQYNGRITQKTEYFESG
jgi:hypothetical protein